MNEQQHWTKIKELLSILLFKMKLGPYTNFCRPGYLYKYTPMIFFTIYRIALLFFPIWQKEHKLHMFLWWIYTHVCCHVHKNASCIHSSSTKNNEFSDILICTFEIKIKSQRNIFCTDLKFQVIVVIIRHESLLAIHIRFQIEACLIF